MPSEKIPPVALSTKSQSVAYILDSSLLDWQLPIYADLLVRSLLG